jgi:PAS domain S-box-containing protein
MRDRLLDVVEDARVFQRAVEETGHSVIITDGDETIEYANPAFESITGYTRAEALGKTPRILKSGETDPAVYEEMWETLQDGASWEGELVNRRKTGERQYIQQTIAPIEGDDGSIEHYVSIGTEITDHKLRKQVLEVYNRVLRHNLRNRVNVVTGNAGLISDGLADDVLAATAEIREAAGDADGDDAPDGIEAATADLESAAETIRRHAETVVDAGERLEALNEKASLADHITRFAEHEEHETPLSERLRAEVETAREANPHASIDLSLPDAEPIACKQSMQTALGELIDNAVEHNPSAAPCVDVSLDVHARRAVVTVADDGPGIPEYERAVLRRGEETPLAHGSGLGLWLVYWVVTMNGGRLEIRDNDPQGTVVEIVLPLPRDEADATRTERRTSGPVRADD